MRVVAKSHLRRFWESRKNDSALAEKDLLTWFKLAETAEWANFGALKQTFGSADQVGNCVVFDVGNNRFRLIGRVFYAAGKLYVLGVMDHAEYDKGAGLTTAGATSHRRRDRRDGRTRVRRGPERLAGGRGGGEQWQSSQPRIGCRTPT